VSTFMTGPSTGAHVLPVEALSRLDLQVGCGGVMLGIDGNGEQVAVQLFRGRPTQAVLVAAGYVARLLAVRALATGATVHVATSRPQAWRSVVTAMAPGRALLVAPGSPLPAETSFGSPVLRCDDIGPGGAAVRADVGAWQTRVVVQDFTPATAVPGLRPFDLVIVQRIPPDLAHPLRTAFGLPPEVADVLPGMPDDVVALLTPGRGILTRLAPTQVETSLLGTPVRHDG
jgi:hypothetical protein